MTSSPTKENGSENDASQEGITVAIRMRPLNNVEGNNGRIWKVLPQYASITQTTREGKPLGERITGRTFFTFDKTFGEGTNNAQVYESVAKRIVTSAVEGLNGTIFAYGQTSSGKTYTMQGSGNLEQGIGGEGGMVHMAANDIFNQIVQKQERIFLVRASFLEIYNEEVRDLLGDTSQILKIREDPRRGVYVESNEEIVTDFDGLLKILIRGDKSRTFASTCMNERSSRSHTILRITIESREKDSNNDIGKSHQDMDIENREPSSDGAVRISTLNLVDLAGSESVRHTGATGERQKEGGLINQSLLTLSRVIVALGSPNQMHINFRDSKLTRILQPSLSGNARMAVICCATASELYLEETRSTLQFASRAKLVKTNAQVNEVLDERSMIKRLQKQLAAAKRNQTGPGRDQVRDMEAKIATAGTQAMEAKKKLDRLKTSILNTGYMFDQDAFYDASSISSQPFEASKKRRKSDGPLLICYPSPSKTEQFTISSPKTAPRHKRSKVLQYPTLDTKQELQLVQQALASRNNFVRDLNVTLDKYSAQIEKKNSDVERMLADNSILKEEKEKACTDVSSMQEMLSSLKQALDSSMKENEQALAEKDKIIMESFEKLQQTLVKQDDLKSQVLEMRDEQEKNETLSNRSNEIELENATLKDRIASLEVVSQRELDDFTAYAKDLESKISEITGKNNQLRNEKAENVSTLQDVNNQLADTSNKLQQLYKEKEEFILNLENANLQLADKSNDLQSKQLQILGNKEEIENLTQLQNKFEQKISTMTKEKASMEAMLLFLQNQVTKIKAEKHFADAANKTLEERHNQVMIEMRSLREDNEAVVFDKGEIEAELAKEKSQKESIDVALLASEQANGKLKETLSKSESELSDLRESNEQMITERNSLVQSLETRQVETEQNLEHERERKRKLEQKIHEMQQTIEDSASLRDTIQNSCDTLSVEKSQIWNELRQCKEELEETHLTVQSIQDEKDDAVAEKNSMEVVLTSYEQSSADMERQLTEAEEQISRIQSEYESVNIKNDKINVQIESMKEEINEASTELSSSKAQLAEAVQKIQSMNNEILTKDSSVEELHADKKQVTSELEEKLSDCRIEIKELQSKLSIKESKLREQQDICTQVSQEKISSAQEICMLIQKNEALKSTLQELEDIGASKQLSLEELKADKDQYIIELEEQLNLCKEKVESLHSSLLDTKIKLEEQETAMEELEDINTAKESSLEQMQVDKNKASQEQEKQLKLCNDELQNVVDEIKSDTAEKEARILELQSEVENLMGSRETLTKGFKDCKAERDKVMREVDLFQVQNNELQNDLENKQTKIRELQCEMETILNSRETLTQSLRNREAERDEATLELERLYDENRKLNNAITRSLPKVKEEKLREEMSELNAQNIELKHLLASVNDSEERLRNAVAAAESECLNKKSELEDAQYRLLQIEQELSQSLVNNDELSQVEGSKAHLEETVEIALKENEHFEKKLQEEKDARIQLQKQMGEEQRTLIQEGENMMIELRSKVGEYEEKLSRSESEAYTARQKIEESNDEMKILEEKYQEASAQVTAFESSIRHHEEDVESLKSELNDSKSESYALKESVIDMKEKMRRSTRDSEKALNELSILRRKLLNLENLSESNQAENSKLREKLKESRENETLVNNLQGELKIKEKQIITARKDMSKLKQEMDSELNKELELTRSGREISKLMNELKKINEVMKEKDERMKMLETKKITKTQLEHIRKIKLDNENHKKKISNLNNEIIQLKNQITSKRTNNDSSSETSELRFHKDALENKLRKYAAHCQRLEDDKAGMIDALRSCNIDMEAHRNDVSEAVYQVCDRLTSIEDIKENSLTLEKENRSTKEKMNEMVQTEHNLVEKLNQYRRERTAMKKQLDSLKTEFAGANSEVMGKKLRFLEQENLQLMQDVKASKRQLQTAREEIESLRMNVEQNPTADFSIMDLQTSTKDADSNLSCTTKESSDTLELTKMAKDCSENNGYTTSRQRYSSRNMNNENGRLSQTNKEKLSNGLEMRGMHNDSLEKKEINEVLKLCRSSGKKRNALADQTNLDESSNLLQSKFRNKSTGLRRSLRNAEKGDTPGNKNAEKPTDKRQKVIGSGITEEQQIYRRSTRSAGLGESSNQGSDETGECKQS